MTSDIKIQIAVTFACLIAIALATWKAGRTLKRNPVQRVEETVEEIPAPDPRLSRQTLVVAWDRHGFYSLTRHMPPSAADHAHFVPMKPTTAHAYLRGYTHVDVWYAAGHGARVGDIATLLGRAGLSPTADVRFYPL